MEMTGMNALDDVCRSCGDDMNPEDAGPGGRLVCARCVATKSVLSVLGV
jgi:hypothetical protein